MKNRGCHKSNALLYSENDTELEFINVGLLGGITKDLREKVKNRKDIENKKTIKKTKTLTTLLDEINAPTTIDYISLDTQGSVNSSIILSIMKQE